MNRAIFVTGISLLLWVLSFSPVVSAQSGSTTGAVVGRVKDQQGAILAGVEVKVRQIETNLERLAYTGEDGQYQVLQLPPGTYEISATVESFAPKLEKIVLNIGTTALVQLTMVPVGAVEVVNVEGDIATETEKTESSLVNGQDRIDNLPINRRNFLDFAVTAPRVAVDRIPVQGVTATSGLSINGQSSRQNNVTIDGLDNNDSSVGTVRSTFSQEAVREFQIVSDSYSAEFGRALGGVVNIVTKGGTNEHHGTLFLFTRNDALGARNAFAETDPPYSQYQFGATLGGRIKKDKYFYFGSFERLTVQQNNIVTIPDDFIASARRRGFNVSNGAQPFALGTTSALGRADLQLNPSDTLTVRYNHGATFDGAFEPFGGLTARTTGATQRLKDNQFAAVNTYINANLNLINETRFLFSKRAQDVLSDADGPRIRIEDANQGRILLGRPSFVDQPRDLRIFQIVNNVSLARGKHTLKFGVDYLRIHGENRVPNFEQGGAAFLDLDLRFLTRPGEEGFFTALQTFDPSLRTPAQRAFLTRIAPLLPAFSLQPNFPTTLKLADLPLPNVYGQGFLANGDTTVNQDLVTLFVQDEFKARSNLLLKAGLRYDYYRTDSYPGNNGYFSPRLAFTYNPAKLPRISLYGTYGLFFAAPVVGPAFIVTPKDRKNLALNLPDSILPFLLPGFHYPVATEFPAGVRFVPQITFRDQIQPDLKASYTQQTGFGVNYFIDRSTTLTFAYQFTRGIRLFGVRDINPVVKPVPGNATLSQLTGRIDPTRGPVNEYESAFDSYYHAFSVSLNKRFSGRFGLQTNYTLSKSIDNSVDFVSNAIQELDNVLNLKSERGLSLQDARHRFVLSGTWQLNYTKNVWLRDFALSSIISLNSGRPFNLLAGADLNLNNIFQDRPRVVGPDGVRRSIGRNAGVTQGFANVDVRLTRMIPLGERYKLQLVLEAFNLFNRVNINELNRIYRADAQGNFDLPRQSDGRYVITRDRFRSAFAPRQFQIGFRFTY